VEDLVVVPEVHVAPTGTASTRGMNCLPRWTTVRSMLFGRGVGASARVSHTHGATRAESSSARDLSLHRRQDGLGRLGDHGRPRLGHPAASGASARLLGERVNHGHDVRGEILERQEPLEPVRRRRHVSAVVGELAQRGG
jgi:hypothetical protein